MAKKVLSVDSISHPEKKSVGKNASKRKKNLTLDVKNPKEYLIVRKVIIYFSIFLVTVSTVFLLAPLIYGYVYKDRVLPGVYVLGEDMGGKYEGELKKIVREKLEKNKFVFRIADQEETAEFSDMGLGIDFIRLADRGLERGKEGNVLSDFEIRYQSLVYYLSPKYYQKHFQKIGVELDYGIDSEKLKSFVEKLSKSIGSSEKNAGLVIKGSDIEVIPAKYGEKIISESLEEQIRHSIAKLKEGEKMVLGVTTDKITSHIKDKDLKESIQKAKKMIKSDVVLLYNDKKYVPKKEEIASWIIFEENGSKLTPKIDRAKTGAYLKNIAKEIDVAAKPKQLRIENGTKEIIKEEGKDGLAVDIAANAELIAGKVEIGESAVIGIITKIVKADVKTERVLIADWAKYVDIDLKTQKMTAYENKQPVFSDSITSGKNGYSTPVGTFLIYSKTRSQTMRGGIPGTTDYYYLPNVQFISWFNGAIAVHETYWRSSFGGADYVWNGSHGCINARRQTAEYIYNWAPIGTPVIVHY